VPDARIPIYPDHSAVLSSSVGVSIREDAAYTNAKGKEKGGIRKRTEKAIEKLQDHLRKILEPEEAVFCAVRAQLPVNFLEQFVLGWLAVVTDAGILVLTNRRLLFFLVTRNGSWKRSVRSVRLGDIQTANVKTFLGAKLELQYQDGSKDHYWKLRGDDAKRLKEMLAAILPASSGERSPAQGMVHLCPQCLTPLNAASCRCANCGQNFKDEKVMIRRTWLFPGAGYFYSGHSGLGVLDFLIEAFLLIEILYVGAEALGFVQMETSPGQAPVTSRAAWVTAAILVGILVGKKVLTIRHCRRFIREFVPVK
jgi:hypothetical protein